MYSLPVYLLNLICYRFFINNLKSAILVKVIINLVSITGTFLILFVISGEKSFNWNENHSGFLYSLVYATSIIISSLFYKVEIAQPKGL